MKKRIVNAIELVLIACSLVIFNMKNLVAINPYAGIKIPVQMSVFELLGDFANHYALLFFYALCVVMCLVSICTGPKHRDGKMHGVAGVLLFLLANYELLSIGVFDPNYPGWQVVEHNFPIAIFEACMLGVLVLSFFKQSTLIAGHPTVKVQKTSSKADELKKYKELLDTGAITQEEYDAKKKQLLGL